MSRPTIHERGRADATLLRTRGHIGGRFPVA